MQTPHSYAHLAPPFGHQRMGYHLAAVGAAFCLNCFVALCSTPHTPIFGLGLGVWIGGSLWLGWKLALLNDSLQQLRFETSFHWLKVSYFLRFLHL